MTVTIEIQVRVEHFLTSPICDGKPSSRRWQHVVLAHITLYRMFNQLKAPWTTPFPYCEVILKFEDETSYAGNAGEFVIGFSQ